MAMLLSSSSSCVPSSFHLSTTIQNPSLSSCNNNKPKKIGWVKEENLKSCYYLRVITVSAKKEDSEEEESSSSTTPSWAKPGSDELPPWARQEAQKESSSFEFPFFAYLLASALTAIAAIGSIFEYVNQKPVFGVLDPDSAFYAPLLGFFVFTGIPSSAYLWFKSVQVANKEAEEQDRRDGYL